MQKYGIYYAFHHLHPSERKYSFFSHVHLMYSHIDYFFLDNTFLPYLQDCCYLSIVISDHVPIILELQIPHQPPKYCRCLSLLSNKDFIEFVSSNISSFIEVSTMAGMPYSTIWENLKFYLCGLIISYSSHKNQEKKRHLKEISNAIALIDSQYASDPSPELFEEHQFLQAEYDILSNDEAEKCILRAQHRVYEQSDRTGKFLAQQIREAEASRVIPQLILLKIPTRCFCNEHFSYWN